MANGILSTTCQKAKKMSLTTRKKARKVGKKVVAAQTVQGSGSKHSKWPKCPGPSINKELDFEIYQVADTELD